jgi:hypothetical protein
MVHGQLGRHVQHFVELVKNNVIVHVFQKLQIVEIIHMNKELVEKQIVNVLLVRFLKQLFYNNLLFIRY